MGVAGFWVALVGTVASVIIAVAAVVLSVKAFRAEAARPTRAEEVEKRLRRSDLARDIIVWFDKGIIYMTVGSDAALLLDDDFVRDGQELDARKDDRLSGSDRLTVGDPGSATGGGRAAGGSTDAGGNQHHPAPEIVAERWVDDPGPSTIRSTRG